MRFDLLLRHGSVWRGAALERADVAIEGERVAAVGDLSGASATEKVDCTGLTVLPGFIDTQVHFREPGATHKEDLESGTRAAICGGVTTVFEMPNTDPPTTTAAALEDKLTRASGRTWCDHAFFVGASADNVGSLAELEMRPGTPGVKIFVGSSTGTLLVESDDLLEAVLRAGSRRCSVHSEHEPRLRERAALFLPGFGPGQHCWLRDAEAATMATARVLRLAARAGRPVHILHISTGDEVPMLAQAKALGQEVTCEVTPQHLWFAAPDAYEAQGTRVQMNPPIREAYHRTALWRGLEEGVFDVFGSDHAPHTAEEKALPYGPGHAGPSSPSGMPGVQTFARALLRFVQEGRLGLDRLVSMAAGRPAELFGLASKGRIEPGFDADLAVFDLGASAPFEEAEIQSRCGWSPFTGLELAAAPRYVYLRGQLASRDGQAVGKPRGVAARFAWKPGDE